MQEADKGTAGNLEGEGLHVGIVRSRFNDSITQTLAAACRKELERLGVDSRDIVEQVVPGALEIPQALRAMAESGDHDALIALGCVIRGETYHFELVANQSAAGVMQVALDHGVAMANAILTVETDAQAWARAESKGADAARVAVEMANLLEEIS
jgi:6,7-dimethyl-8-ribityllumazine synthase